MDYPRRRQLLSKIAKRERELEQLKRQLADAETGEDLQEKGVATNNQPSKGSRTASLNWPWPLRRDEYQRYGRQMILPEIGLQGQLYLKDASVLVIGLGGLGCPAAVYLAGAGIGTIGMMDGDSVGLSNLHRQILHTTARVGEAKVESARTSLEQLNPQLRYVTHAKHLTPEVAPELFPNYDLILDCTDQPSSRYLISDAAILSGKPLISAGALRADGTLNCFNFPQPTAADPYARGPCYRCVFPTPPPPETIVPCGEGGVIGPAVGLMGVLMALEAIKLISAGAHRQDYKPVAESQPGKSTHPMLLFSGMSDPQFRVARLRGRRPDCPACSARPSITVESLTSGSLDYVQFCGSTIAPTLRDEDRISAQQLAIMLERGGIGANKELSQKLLKEHIESELVLLDVRTRPQFGICSLPGSINVPLPTLMAVSDADAVQRLLMTDKRSNGPLPREIVTICRLGNDSQVAVKHLRGIGLGDHPKAKTTDNELESSRTPDWAPRIRDVRSGFEGWRQQVDPTWPEY